MTLTYESNFAMHQTAFTRRLKQPVRQQLCAILAAAAILSLNTSLAQESALQIADSVRAKANPTGVLKGVTAFHAPAGNGRRGANGLYIPPGKSAADQVTEFSLTHQRSGSARGVQMIHPLKDGHVVITIMNDQINVVAGGKWPGYFGRKSPLTELTDVYADTFPLKDAQTISVRTRVFPNGVTEVVVDGKVMAVAFIEQASAFTLTDGFKLIDGFNPASASLPETWPAGAAGIIIGPRDSQVNVAQKVVLRRLEASGIPLPKVAMKAEPVPKPATPTKTSPSSIPQKPAPTTVAAGTKVTLDTPVKRVLAVWGIHDGKGTYRVQVFSDGTTNQNYAWKPISRTKIEIADGVADLVDGGSTLLGRWKRGAPMDGRLLMEGGWVAGTTDTIEDIQPAAELDSTDRAFQENLAGNWHLAASNRRKKIQVSVPVTFSADHRVIESGRTIATWTSDRTRIDIRFLDPSIGTATLSPRKKDELSGRAKSANNDLWTIRIDRIKELSTWDTDQLGTVVLYSNRRVSDPLGANGHGFWWQEGKNLRFASYSVSLSADRRSFTGRGAYGTGIKGTLLAGPQN